VIVAINPGEHYLSFDLGAATRSYCAHRKSIDKKRAGSDKLNASALRRWKSRVRIAAQKLAKLKGQTDYLVNVEAQWDTIRSAVSKRLREFPAIIARMLGVSFIRLFMGTDDKWVARDFKRS